MYVLVQERAEESKAKKFLKMGQEDLSAEGADQEEQKEIIESIKKAQTRTTFFKSRDEYKQKRLEKILKEKEKPSGPTIEELDTKPGVKDIRVRPLV